MMKIIFFYFFATAAAQSSCNPFELKCSVNEFIVRVYESCLDADVPSDSVSINYRDDEGCRIQNIDGRSQIQFLFSECGTSSRYLYNVIMFWPKIQSTCL